MTRFPALQSRNFRLLWMGQGISGIGSMMQVWALNWQLYALTHSPVALGMIGLFRVVPIILFSLVGGAVADAWDRRKIMLATQTTLALTALAYGLLTVTGHLTAAMMYALTVVSAAAMSFDNPARQSLVPRLVTPDQLPSALSMMSVMFRTATILGPVAAGFLIARGGLPVTYFINAASFLAVIGALLAMKLEPSFFSPRVVSPSRLDTPLPSEERAVKGEGPGVSVEALADASAVDTPATDDRPAAEPVSIAAIKEGLDFVRSTPLLVSTMLLDFLATFFSSANALLPIFARDILHVDARGYGILAAAEAVGALTAGFALSMSGPIRRQGTAIIASVVVYGATTVLFGVSHWFILSWLALALSGASDAVSTVLRQTIRQLMTPDRLRGRMTSVMMVFFMGGPQLGEFEAGLVAKWLGAPLSVIVGGVGCLLTVIAVVAKYPVLRQYRYESAVAHPRV